LRDMGCEFLCCMAMVAHMSMTSIEAQTINDVWEQLVAEDLADDIFGLHSALSYYRAFDILFDALGMYHSSGDQVGVITDGQVIYWDWVTKRHFDYAIRRMSTGTGTKHSVLLNQDFREIYNPAPEYPGGRTIGIYLFQVSHQDVHPIKTD